MSSKTLTRADITEMLHTEIGLSRAESADMVNNILDYISDALVAGQSVKLSSFGTFMLRAKRERMGRNPKTGVEVPITPRRVLVFRPSQIMKNIVNGQEPGTED